jgi:hypothetical protein
MIKVVLNVTFGLYNKTFFFAKIPFGNDRQREIAAPIYAEITMIRNGR